MLLLDDLEVIWSHTSAGVSIRVVGQVDRQCSLGTLHKVPVEVAMHVHGPRDDPGKLAVAEWLIHSPYPNCKDEALQGVKDFFLPLIEDNLSTHWVDPCSTEDSK